MATDPTLRRGEIIVELPPAQDAGLIFIGRIRTPWASRKDAPRQGSQDGPLCRVEIFAPWVPALTGIERYEHIDVVYWLHLARRDLVLQSPKSDGSTQGTFSLRSPVRPNPIGISRVRLAAIEGNSLLVHGLDCVDGTPLIDLKPEGCAFSPLPEGVTEKLIGKA